MVLVGRTARACVPSEVRGRNIRVRVCAAHFSVQFSTVVTPLQYLRGLWGSGLCHVTVVLSNSIPTCNDTITHQHHRDCFVVFAFIPCLGARFGRRSERRQHLYSSELRVGHLFDAPNTRPQAADPRASVACSQARLRLHVDRRPSHDRQRPTAKRPRRTDLRLGRSAARPPRMQRVIDSACLVSAKSVDASVGARAKSSVTS